MKVTASNGEEVKILGLTLKNSNGEIVKKVSFTGDDQLVGNEKSFYIDAVKLTALTDSKNVRV